MFGMNPMYGIAAALMAGFDVMGGHRVREPMTRVLSGYGASGNTRKSSGASGRKSYTYKGGEHARERERHLRRKDHLFGSGRWHAVPDEGALVKAVPEWPGCKVTPRQPDAFHYVTDGALSRQVRRYRERRYEKNRASQEKRMYRGAH